MPNKDYDLILFGGGMVGAAVALGYARQGKKLAIVEPAKPLITALSGEPDLRVSAISYGSELILRELGAWQHLQEERLKRYLKLSAWELKSCKTEFSHSEANVAWLGHILENQNLQLALYKALESYAHQISWYECGSVDDANAGVCQLEGHEYSASLVVAADGANSSIRQALQMGETGWQYRQKVLSVNIRTELPGPEHTYQQFSAQGPMAYLPLFENYGNLVWYHEANTVEQLAKLNSRDLKAQIKAEFPALPGDFDILDKACFPIRRNHANQYFKGRVVLCGDAAHNINPLAGQGVNIGFQDVAELLKVDTALPLSAQLKRYESQRRKENLVMMSAMDAINVAFSNSNPILKGMRNAGLWLAQNSGPLKSMALKKALGI